MRAHDGNTGTVVPGARASGSLIAASVEEKEGGRGCLGAFRDLGYVRCLPSVFLDSVLVVAAPSTSHTGVTGVPPVKYGNLGSEWAPASSAAVAGGGGGGCG